MLDWTKNLHCASKLCSGSVAKRTGSRMDTAPRIETGRWCLKRVEKFHPTDRKAVSLALHIPLGTSTPPPFFDISSSTLSLDDDRIALSLSTFPDRRWSTSLAMLQRSYLQHVGFEDRKNMQSNLHDVLTLALPRYLTLVPRRDE